MSRQPDLAKAERMAERVLLRLKIDRLPVRPLEILRRCRNTAVYTYDRLMAELGWSEGTAAWNSADACTFHETQDGKDRYIVCYRPGGNPARLNFTLAHELGHILLKHHGNDPAEEAEADRFAGCLLCPDAAIRLLPTATAERLARLCFISKDAAACALRRNKTLASSPVEQQIADYIAGYLAAGERHLLHRANGNG